MLNSRAHWNQIIEINLIELLLIKLIISPSQVNKTGSVFLSLDTTILMLVSGAYELSIVGLMTNPTLEQESLCLNSAKMAG